MTDDERAAIERAATKLLPYFSAGVKKRKVADAMEAALSPLLAAKDERIAELRRTLSRLHDEADFAYQYLEAYRAKSKSYHAKLHANLGAVVDEAWALLRATRPAAALSPAAEQQP